MGVYLSRATGPEGGGERVEMLPPLRVQEAFIKADADVGGTCGKQGPLKRSFSADGTFTVRRMFKKKTPYVCTTDY